MSGSILHVVFKDCASGIEDAGDLWTRGLFAPAWNISGTNTAGCAERESVEVGRSVTYGSLCSGIEAATVAWDSLGWRCAFVADIEPFCSALLNHYYPEVPNLGDINAADFIEKAKRCGPIDVLVGGPPCQAFSVAGLRGGLDDARGNLTLRYLAVVDALRPEYVVYENVPGILSATSHVAPDPRPPALDLDGDDGPADGTEIMVVDEYDSDEDHAFSCFLAGLSELGYGWAFGILDAQYFNLAQRRERVFVIGCPRDWQPAAAILLDTESMLGHPPPSRETRQGVAGTLSARTEGGGGLGTDFEIGGGYNLSPPLTATGRGTDRAGESRGQDCVIPLITHCQDVAPCLTQNYGKQPDNSDTNTGPMLVTHALTGEGHDASEDGTGRGTPIVTVFDSKASGRNGFGVSDTTASTLRAMGHKDTHQNAGGQLAVSISLRGRDGGATAEMGGEQAGALRAGGGGGDKAHVLTSAVRRLTPRECERLQGFPDDYTAIPYRGKPAADGPRYKALGNSFAVPVIQYIGMRIQAIEDGINGRK